jgi:hypothetical protein
VRRRQLARSTRCTSPRATSPVGGVEPTIPGTRVIRGGSDRREVQAAAGWLLLPAWPGCRVVC